MKFDTRTIQILKNFSSIQPSLLFNKSEYVTTISLSQNVIARARLPIEIEKEFAVYDLNRFLGVMSLFDSPNIEIGNSQLHISSEDSLRKTDYTFADRSMVYQPPSNADINALNDGGNKIGFVLTPEILSTLLKALGVLQLPEIAIVGDGKHIRMKAIDDNNPTGDSYSLIVGYTDKIFKFVFRSENIKMLSDTYNVELNSKGFAYFKSNDIEYWIQSQSASGTYE